MSTNFRELVFENQNSISVTVAVEAPVGTRIIETEVRPQTTVTLQPNVSDISSVRMTVVAGGPEHTDKQTWDLRGSPFPIFFETLKARATIGSIHGLVSAAF
jgi:hypothetical protein